MDAGLPALRIYAAVARPFGYRGMQRYSWMLGRLGAKGSAVVEIGGGARLRIPVSDGYWSKLIFGERYEPEVGAVLAAELPGAAGFIDCGANIGHWALIASCRFHVPTIAVEPAEATYLRLCENIALSKADVRAVRAAVSSHEGTAVLVTHPQRHAGATIVGRRERIGHGAYTTESVETVTLDALSQDLPPGRIVVKLDVEGAELDVLEGARTLLTEHDTVLIYEDHEQDESCAVSARLVELGCALYAGERQVTVEEIRRLKRGRGGANFVARAGS